MVVYTPSRRGEYDQVARDIAAERGEQVVTEIAGAVGERSVYVAPPTEIGERDLLRLQRELQRHGPNEVGFSVVTGRTPAEARALYDRAAVGGEKHAMLFRKLNTEWTVPDQSVETLWSGDVTTEQLRRLSRTEQLGSLTLLTGGRAIHGYLSDGYLCGVPSDTESATFTGKQPYCVADGEPSCPLDGELINSDQVRADHVFLQACSSMIPNRHAAPPVHVGLGLLSGSRSVIGPYRPIGIFTEEAGLHYALLRAGYDVTERVYLLNRFRNVIEPESYPYVCFGNPGATATDPVPQQYEVDWTDDGSLVVENVAAHVVDVTVAADQFQRPADAIHLSDTTATGEEELHYTVFEEGDRYRVLVWGWGRIEPDSLEFEVRGRLRTTRRWELVTQSLAGATHLARLGLLPSDAEGHLQNLTQRVETFSGELSAFASDTAAYDRVDEELSEIEAAITRTQDAIEETLVDYERTRWPASYARRVTHRGGSAGAESCPYCERKLFVQRVVSPAERVRRRQARCPKHGWVFDVPAGSDTYPEVLGHAQQIDPEPHPVVVRFRNSRDHPMSGVVVPFLKTESPDTRGRTHLSPERVPFDLDPGETVTATVEIAADRLSRNNVEFNAYVVGNLDVYWGFREIVVGESVGHRPPDGYRGR